MDSGRPRTVKKEMIKTNSEPERLWIMKTIMYRPIFKINVTFLWTQNKLARISRNSGSTIFSLQFAVVRRSTVTLWTPSHVQAVPAEYEWSDITRAAELSRCSWTLAFTDPNHSEQLVKDVGWDCFLGVATRYGLDGPGIKSRWGWDFAHPSSPSLGPTQPPVQWVPGLFPGDKAARSWSWPSTPSSAKVKERVQRYLCSPCGTSWPGIEWTSLLLVVIKNNVWKETGEKLETDGTL